MLIVCLNESRSFQILDSIPPKFEQNINNDSTRTSIFHWDVPFLQSVLPSNVNWYTVDHVQKMFGTCRITEITAWNMRPGLKLWALRSLRLPQQEELTMWIRTQSISLIRSYRVYRNSLSDPFRNMLSNMPQSSQNLEASVRKDHLF